MKGKVTSLISGSESSDGQRRVEILFEGCDAMFRKLRVPEKLLGIVGLKLDDEVVVAVSPMPRASELAGARVDMDGEPKHANTDAILAARAQQKREPFL
jgi:hypothetical protein